MKLNKNSIIYVIVICFVTFIFLIQLNNFSKVSSSGVHTAQKGVLELSHWDFDTHPLRALDGEWLFFYEQLLVPGDDNVSAHGYINVPGLWNSFTHRGESIGSDGYATYQLKVLLPENYQEELALKVPDMSSSYRLFVDGEEICANGVVGKSHQEEVPAWKPLVRTIGTKSGQMDITVHVSNYHHIKGGIWESILLGTEEAVYQNRELNLMLSFLLIGVLLITALYYLVVFSNIKRNLAALFLAAFCMSAALRESMIREVVAGLVIPDLSFNLISKLEYMTVPSGPLLLALSLYGLYPSVFPKKSLKAIVPVFSFYIIFIALTPLKSFAVLMNTCLILFVITFIYLLFIIATAAKEKKPGAGLLLLGTIIMLTAALIDMAYYRQIHSQYGLSYTFSIGFIIFILSQMRSLSLTIADIFKRSENMSKAELAFLQAQIVPHFLYNTLSTIIHLTRESPEKARSLLLELSNYLRGKFNFKAYSENNFVSLEYELGIVKSYLTIESVRLNDRLEVTYNIDPQALGHEILPFTLQPLVENAVRHGLKNRPKQCKIIISARRAQDSLVITVEDNGVGMSRASILAIKNGHPIGNGTGLYNVNQRLNTVYGAGLSISSTINTGTVINITIPLREGQKHA